jgi:hypothetical protein
MKYQLSIALFTIINFSSLASECNLTPALKAKLIKQIPYAVDDVKCASDGSYKWIISNKKFNAPIFVGDRAIANTKKESAVEAREESLITKSKEPIADVEVETDIPLQKDNTYGQKETKAAVAKEEKKEDEKLRVQSLFLSLNSGIASISSTDTASGSTEKAVTDIGYGVTAVWSHHWTRKTKYFFVGSMKKYTFKMGSSRNLSNGSVTQTYVGTGVSHKFGDRMKLSLGAGFGQSFILTSQGGSNFTIDKANIPVISLGANHHLYKFQSGYSFDLNWRVGAMLGASQDGYETESGQFYNIGFGSSYDLGGKILNINTFYTNRELEVGSATQDSQELGISVGIGWSF